MDIAVIGGGAAGFFSAIHAKENHPQARVVIVEKSQKLLAKVKISGGGRCNMTHGCTDIAELCKAYPRGGNKLKKAFHRFHTRDTMDWFESRGGAPAHSGRRLRISGIPKFSEHYRLSAKRVAESQREDGSLCVPLCLCVLNEGV